MDQRYRLPLGVLARKGVAAGIVKLASAVLTFAVFVVAAMAMDERQFGLFSTAYAGASLVSFFSLVGQHAAVMRFWPQYAGVRDFSSANSFMCRAVCVATTGILVSTVIVLAGGSLPVSGLAAWAALMTATAGLSAALGWSEFTACAFRAKGAVVTGLLPRDIVWRAASILAFVLAGRVAPGLSAVVATALIAVLLALCVLPQTVLLLRDTLSVPRMPLSIGQKAEFKAVTLGLWGVTALPPALGQASTLVVAGLLGPEKAGAIFVADRITRLAVLALNGINQAAAPQIAGAFHAGDRVHVQRITGLVAIAGFAVAVAVLAAFAISGLSILALFDQAYANGTMHAALVVLGFGALIGTACGPTELTMQLTGLQRELFLTLLVVNILGLAATAGLALAHGPLGAAVGMAGTTALWCLIGAAITRRRIGIDPSIFGFIAGRRVFAARAAPGGRS